MFSAIIINNRLSVIIRLSVIFKENTSCNLFLQQKYNILEYDIDDKPPRKNWHFTGWAKRVDAFHLKQNYLTPELLEMIRQSNIDRSVYTKFKNQVLTSGTIKWRYNRDGRNVCVMNDYSINGHLIPNLFVHISSETKENDKSTISSKM